MNEIDISGLEPLTTYSFTVRAHLSENNFGEFSQPKKLKTIGTGMLYFYN